MLTDEVVAEHAGGRIANEFSNTKEAVNAHAARMFAHAVQMDMRPVVAELNAILAITDRTIFNEKLVAWLARADEVKRNIGADPEAARILQSAIAEALAGGLKK